MSKKLPWLVAGFVLLAAFAYAADDEQPQAVDLARSFVFLAQDGAMTASADFKSATFHALPKAMAGQSLKTPNIFNNADNTVFAFYRAEAGVWSCHLDATGWVAEKTTDFAFSKIKRIDENTFTAEGVYEKEPPEAVKEIVVEEPIEWEVEVDVWTGKVLGRRVVWEKTGSTIITVHNGMLSSSEFLMRARVDEWRTAETVRDGDTVCKLQYRTVEKNCYRFQVGASSAAEPMTGVEFKLDEALRPRSIEYFAWDGESVDALQALLLMSSSTAEGKGDQLHWLLCKRGGAECAEVFAKEWQGRKLLKTLKPVSGK